MGKTGLTKFARRKDLGLKVELFGTTVGQVTSGKKLTQHSTLRTSYQQSSAEVFV